MMDRKQILTQWRRLRGGMQSALLGLLLAISGLATTGVAHAASGSYAASDVLGQLTGGVPDFTTHGIGTTDSTFNYPDGVALDSVHHRLFVADDSNARVLIFNLDNTNALVDHQADYVLGQSNFTSSTPGTTATTLGGPYASVLYDPAHDRLFVSDNSNSRVLVYSLSGGISSGMTASYVLGQPDFTSQAQVTTQAGMINPESMAFDPARQLLFVSDYTSHRVTAYDVTPGVIANGMNASYVLGQPDFTASSTAFTQSGVNQPEAMVYDTTTKQLFVGDSRNYRVLVFDLSGAITNGMNAAHVLGQANFTDHTSPGTTQRAVGRYQEGMGIDESRQLLYVQDDENNRIMIFDLSNGVTDNMNAVMVLGQQDFASNSYSASPSTATNLNDSEGSIAVDSANNRIYVPDASFNRVLVFNLAQLQPSLIGATAGTTYASPVLGRNLQGTPVYTVTSGTLPNGLSLNSTTGVIGGTATQAGNYAFTVSVFDDNGAIGGLTERHSYVLGVAAAAVQAPRTGFGVPDAHYDGALILGGIGIVSIISGLLLIRRQSAHNGAL